MISAGKLVVIAAEEKKKKQGTVWMDYCKVK